MSNYKNIKVHELKTVQPFFDMVWSMSKTFEIRKNDRDFKPGDWVILREYNAITGSYSGREIRGPILYVLKDFEALKEGYVCFSFKVKKHK